MNKTNQHRSGPWAGGQVGRWVVQSWKCIILYHGHSGCQASLALSALQLAVSKDLYFTYSLQWRKVGRDWEVQKHSHSHVVGSEWQSPGGGA